VGSSNESGEPGLGFPQTPSAVEGHVNENSRE